MMDGGMNPLADEAQEYTSLGGCTPFPNGRVSPFRLDLYIPEQPGAAAAVSDAFPVVFFARAACPACVRSAYEQLFAPV